MASGVVPGPGASREKQRWGNDKGCSRKTLNKPKDAAGIPRRQFSKKNVSSALDDGDESSPPALGPASRLECASSDSSSSRSGAPAGSDGIPGYSRCDKWVTISLSSMSKFDRKSVKRKLVHDLDHVRGVVRRLETTEPQVGGHRNNVDVGPANSRLSVSTAAENRTPKINKQFRNSDCASGKDMPMPLESNKKVKSRTGVKKDDKALESQKELRQVFKSCSNLLFKLMKHKLGWVFNAPVDVKGLNLHDYYTIIKKPMDLGTIKTRLSQNWYKSPLEFAEDVRLTFNNAMLYNPKGQDVHYMAERLLKLFEEKWPAIEAQYKNLNRRIKSSQDADLPPPVSRRTPDRNHMPDSPTAPRARAQPAPERRVLERAESMTMPTDPKTRIVSSDQAKRSPPSRKTDVEEPKRRDMTYEEKRKLSEDLQNMPSDKLESIVQIIRKRNPSLSQQDDEIEVDIESVDCETLWELENFVAEYKKSLNEDKRKGELYFEKTAEAGHCAGQDINTIDVTEKPKVTESVENNQMESFPTRRANHVQACNDGSGTSNSRSSSSDSGSSSSDSDSDSSSGYGSNTGNSPRIEVI